MIPTFHVGNFHAAFNIDAAKIISYSHESPILPFLSSFINSLNYRGRFLTFDLDRSTPLAGDRAGLFEGVVHQWDGLEEKLSLNFMLDTEFFDFRSYADDLSFSSQDDDALILSGNVLSFTLSRAWPVEIAFEFFSAVSYNKKENSTFYPILFVDAPLVNVSDISFGLRFGMLGRMKSLSLDEFINSEKSYFLSIPFSIKDDEMSLGVYFQHDGVYYNLFNENYKPDTERDSIAVFFDSDLAFDRFKLNINTFISLDKSDLKLIYDNSYLDVAVSFKLGNIDFLMGARKQNLFEYDDFLSTSDFYLGMDLETGSIVSEFLIRYKNGHPEIGFSSSLAFIDVDNNVYRDYIPEKLLSLQFDLGFENYFEAGLYFNISPILTFRNDDLILSFRIPIYLELLEGSMRMVSLKADPWFDMWRKNDSIEDVYDSVTDIFSLIERISIGKSEDSIFYIDASRDERKSDVFFENYSSFDALSLNMGFNFYNLDFGIYVDDMESPRIIDPYFSFYPINDANFSFSLSAPTELIMKDMRNFSLRSFLGFTYTQPFFNERLSFSFFLYGETYAEYVDGTPVKTTVIYDFENMELYGYLLGGELRWDDDVFSFGINGGIHSGSLYPNYFNAFSSLNPDMDRSDDKIEGLSYYAIAETSLSLRNFKFLIRYSLPNIVALIEGPTTYKGDMFTLDLEFTLHNGIGMHLALSKLDFISSFSSPDNLEAYMNNENTIYSASLTKDFDNMSLEVELSTVAIYEESGYINSYRLKEVSPRLKINSRIGF